MGRIVGLGVNSDRPAFRDAGARIRRVLGLEQLGARFHLRRRRQLGVRSQQAQVVALGLPSFSSAPCAPHPPDPSAMSRRARRLR
jgi:hypothetical protein